MSGVRAARHYLPEMTKRGWGTSTESALAIPKDTIDYGMTNSPFPEGWRTRSPERVTNAVIPGPSNTDILSSWMEAVAQSQSITRKEAEEQFLRKIRPTTPFKGFTTTDDVANMVVYSCSEQASGTTGAAMRVDGGVLRS
jgi:hypothetical protein